MTKKLGLRFIVFFISLYFLIEFIIESEEINTMQGIKLFILIFCFTILMLLYNKKHLFDK